VRRATSQGVIYVQPGLVVYTAQLSKLDRSIGPLGLQSWDWLHGKKIKRIQFSFPSFESYLSPIPQSYYHWLPMLSCMVVYVCAWAWVGVYVVLLRAPPPLLRVAVKKPAGYKPLPTDSNIEDNAVGELGDASTPAAANTSESLAKAAAAAKAKKAKLMAATAALSKNKGKPVGGQSFSPLLEKYEPRRSLAGCCAHKFTITLTFAVYVIGFASLFMYAKFLAENSPTMTFKQTTLPVILHIVGVGGCALLKSYYDFSSDVGYFEAMTLIIRSRMWLFPGVLGETTRVKREDVEEERRQQVRGKQQVLCFLMCTCIEVKCGAAVYVSSRGWFYS